MTYSIALFGEAEKGLFRAAYYCRSLDQLSEFLGEPPNEEAKGLQLAIQALMYQYDVIYFRVHEEGYSTNDYLSALAILEKKELFPRISAICLPGVGSSEIISATDPICSLYNSFLIMNEKDLYDYLTN